MSRRPIITLLTDFGLSDHYVASMKGVMLSICPEAQFIDISHDVSPFEIPEAAYTLSQVWDCFPPGTIHLAVVDPGVGSARRPIMMDAGGHFFVSPDNGILTMVLDLVPEYSIHHITAEAYFRQPVSHTFHGRDVFAPVAAHLASGVPPAQFGERIHDPIRLGFSRPTQIGPRDWAGAILRIDHFGNIVTNFRSKDFEWVAEKPFRLLVGRQPVSLFRPRYSEAQGGEIFVIKGSGGFLEISINQESAAKTLGAVTRTPVELQSL